MDACQTACRVLTLLLGLCSFSVIIFICCDLGMNFMVCKLPFDIIGRLAIACSILYISSCCGLLPKPKIPVLRNWPTPWKYYGSFSLSTQHQNISADSCRTSTSPSLSARIPFARQRFRDERSTKIYPTVYEREERPYVSVIDCCQPEESSRSRRVLTLPPVQRQRGKRPTEMSRTSHQSTEGQPVSADDSHIQEASTSKGHDVISPYTARRHETSSKTNSKDTKLKKVRFALAYADQGTGGGTEDHDASSYKNVAPKVGLKKTQLRNPNYRSTVDSVDHHRARLIDLGVKLEPRSVLKEQANRDSYSRVLVEQNKEREDGSPNAVSLPIPIPNPGKSAHYAHKKNPARSAYANFSHGRTHKKG